jgi:Protein of unknown function (DUF3306)
MTESSENFLSRWWRLKQKSRREGVAENDSVLKTRQDGPGATGRPAGPDRHDGPDGHQKSLATETESPALPHVDLTTLPHVDLTTLPDIGSIGPDSDIRPFLQAGVPQELTGAALRSAWVADPSIRDFVEIADNQWDFNAESGIPGFGSLGSADYARREIARALQAFDDLQPEPPLSDGEMDMTASPPAVVPGPQIVDEVWKVGSADVGTGKGDRRPTVGAPAAAEVAEPSTLERPHGTALPK